MTITLQAESTATLSVGLIMSQGCWRGVQPLQARRHEQHAFERAECRSSLRRAREIEEWYSTGDRPFQPKLRSYPNGGGVEGVGKFLASVERALHLHDRGKTLTREMSRAMSSLERQEVALVEACRHFCEDHEPHMHTQRRADWIIGAEELQLFADVASKMSAAERRAFVNVLTPHRDKSKAHIGALEPLKNRLRRATKASVQQAVSGAIFGQGPPGQHGGRFSRMPRVAKSTPGP